MAVRDGMINLVSQMRSYIQESGTVIFSDDRLQQILDANSEQFTQIQLHPKPYYNNGSVWYSTYVIDKTWIEGTASSTTKIYNSNGTVVTNYTSDFVNGQFEFNLNTLGTVYYMSGKSFNFFKAVSEGWNEKAGYYSTQFDFDVEGRSFKKSQIIKHCTERIKYFMAQANVSQGSIDRGDMC